MVGGLFTKIFKTRFAKAREGIAALEFALIAPVFLLIIFGIVEIATIMYTSAVLESATTISSRLGKTGYEQAGQTRQDLIYNMIRNRAGMLVRMDQIQIEALSYSNFSEIGQPEPFTDLNGNGVRNFNEPYSDVNGNGQWDADMGVAGLGGADDIVLYRVTYPWQLHTPIVSRFIGNASGVYTIRSSVIVKNEPYNVVQIGG